LPLLNFLVVVSRSCSEMLWTAPEIVRGQADPMGTQEGDVYSFAIIASELVTKKTAWDIDNRKETAEDIVQQIRVPSMEPLRPTVEIDQHVEVPQALVHLIRECWSEEPRHRHPMKKVKQLLSSLQKGKKRNLMDHVMNTLENYASSLETEVEQRMVELTEEKKKSDILLYRMLPKQVAERLKKGQTIEPESYDNVTVFFSDVVGFTTIASKGSPMQVVTLLNELYTLFDNAIAKHDVYKIETIGDGYMCVSGLPIRNGLEHIREICNLSLELIDGLRAFRVSYLPMEKVNIRVGVHCGPVVAGVVGLTMPRYCLFGDTVNTASRMESNGRRKCSCARRLGSPTEVEQRPTLQPTGRNPVSPSRYRHAFSAASVHLSMDAHELLMRTQSGYHTESRGEVLIKGKGVMETYWLTGQQGGINIQSATTNKVMDAI
uniref:Guanylate cyclase n=1 Tax=Heligmosomoides polygyrus TaxID=6339 RepID=A0A8L8JYS1_HELPZ